MLEYNEHRAVQIFHTSPSGYNIIYKHIFTRKIQLLFF